MLPSARMRRKAWQRSAPCWPACTGSVRDSGSGMICIRPSGTLLGTLATHFRSVHRPTEQDLRLLDLYVRQAADIIEHHRDITQRKELEDHKSTLISELDHRVKNVLALVSAVASRTQETSS